MRTESEAAAERSTVRIVGAGPAGLSAAIAARRLGKSVTVYEQHADVGSRFHGDFQGLENWTSTTDVLEELSSFGIATTFDHTAFREVTYFSGRQEPQTIRSTKPFFYLVRRGAADGTLDYALKKKALADGVSIRFADRRRVLPDGGIVAEGPHRPDIVAVGYVFETAMSDRCCVAIGKHLAGAGYSYLLVVGGRGTIATCLFADFHRDKLYLENTVAFFQARVDLKWINPRRFGGIGNVDLVRQQFLGDKTYVGEVSGLQDALFGFGLRYAMTSGYLSGLGPDNDVYVRTELQRLRGLNTASIANRWLFNCLGERGRELLLQRIANNDDPIAVLRRLYACSWWKKPLTRHLPRRILLPPALLNANCDCTWCRCHRRGSSSSTLTA